MTLGVAASVVALVLGGGFVLQRVALRTPPPASEKALHAAQWLQRYRYVSSTFALGGRTVHGECLQDWFQAEGARRRGAVLRLDDGFTLVDIPPHTLEARGGTAAARAAPPLVLLELAGCPRLLARRLDTLAMGREGLVQSGDAVVFSLKGTRLRVGLQPRSDLPVSVGVVGGGLRIASRIRFAPMTTAMRRRLTRGIPFAARSLGTS